MRIQRLNVSNKTELYNPSQYENRSKDIADHVKINKKIGAISMMTQKVSVVQIMIEIVTSKGEIFMLTLMKT